MYNLSFEDIAIPIAWPDQTARGDEKWYTILKKLGVIKNLNFKVGHAAIILIKKETGELRYFDFGRYIAPRGHGRARSAKSDPRLKLYSKAIIHHNEVNNLTEILDELHLIEEATHGAGRLYCSQANQINFEKGVQFAESIVDKGPILYGALANKNNSCSRFVAQILIASMKQDDPRTRKIHFPESIKPSPMSNVVNAVVDHSIYLYFEGKLKNMLMSRFASFRFQINSLKDNFSSALAKFLPDDSKPGKIDELPRHAHIPNQARWLGGIGEGVWFELRKESEFYHIYRYHAKGQIDYAVAAEPLQLFDYSRAFDWTYQVHYEKHVLTQDGKDIHFITKYELQTQEYSEKEISKII